MDEGQFLRPGKLLDLPFGLRGCGSVWIEARANHALRRVGPGVLDPAPFLVCFHSRWHIVGDARVVAAIPALQQIERPPCMWGFTVCANVLLVTHGVIEVIRGSPGGGVLMLPLFGALDNHIRTYFILNRTETLNLVPITAIIGTNGDVRETGSRASRHLPKTA